MTKYNKIYQKVKEITQGNYQLSCSEPLSEVKSLIVMLSYYYPTKEENIFSRNMVLEQLRKWKNDLILGGCKK